MALAVLLRDGTHAGEGGTIAGEHYLLKCDSVSIQIAKTPIQIPVPQQSPTLFDIGIFRPSITVSGLVDTTSSAPGGSSPYMDGEVIDGQNYKIPYKNILEQISQTWIADGSDVIELEVGELTDHRSDAVTSATTPWTTTNDTMSGLNHTGGAIYNVAFQQARFEFTGGEEHYWSYTLQFVATGRTDITFPS
tara:strand:+ start:6105 stop:6680 length:576 start_codon:yes stop_codon:yes gene_type:complete